MTRIAQQKNTPYEIQGYFALLLILPFVGYLGLLIANRRRYQRSISLLEGLVVVVSGTIWLLWFIQGPNLLWKFSLGSIGTLFLFLYVLQREALEHAVYKIMWFSNPGVLLLASILGPVFSAIASIYMFEDLATGPIEQNGQASVLLVQLSALYFISVLILLANMAHVVFEKSLLHSLIESLPVDEVIELLAYKLSVFGIVLYWLFKRGFA